MSARTEAYARYLAEIYRDYDALVGNERLIDEIHLSTVGVQPEQIISLSESFDIEELAFLILMETSREAEDDLHDLLEDMRAVTQAKRRLRDLSARLKKRMEGEEQADREEYRQRDDHERGDFERLDFTLIAQAFITVAAQQSAREAQQLADDLGLTRQRIRRAEQIDSAKHDLDSLSELGEIESLRLQMMLDRLSKFEQTLSNLMKKLADTNAAITQNLK